MKYEKTNSVNNHTNEIKTWKFMLDAKTNG